MRTVQVMLFMQKYAASWTTVAVLSFGGDQAVGMEIGNNLMSISEFEPVSAWNRLLVAEPELQCDVQMTRKFFNNKAVAQIQQMRSDHLDGPSTRVHKHLVLCLEKVDRYCPGAAK